MKAGAWSMQHAWFVVAYNENVIEYKIGIRSINTKSKLMDMVAKEPETPDTH